MPNFDRALWRTASRLVTTLEAQRHRELTVILPQRSWSRLQSLTRQLALAGQYGWTVATQSVRETLNSQLRWLANDLKSLVTETNDPVGDLYPCVRDVYEDLRALETRFDRLEIDRSAATISVTTESIRLDDLELGPFRLVWNWSQLEQGDALRVIAEEPHFSACREDVSHPHVQDEILCEGEAQRALRRAERSGRLLDYFEIVERVLQTYNPSSAYVALSEWDCRRCPACDEAVDPDDLGSCEACAEECCADCQISCTTCGGALCHHCALTCLRCQASLCRRCRSTRRGHPYCGACFQKESHHEDHSTSATAAAPDELAVHADRLGEAPVSAGCG